MALVDVFFYNLVVVLMWLFEEASHIYLYFHVDWKSEASLGSLFFFVAMWFSVV